LAFAAPAPFALIVTAVTARRGKKISSFHGFSEKMQIINFKIDA
jgi:hypothetical protein